MSERESDDKQSAWSERELKHFEKRLLEERRDVLVQMGKFQDQQGVSITEAAGELSSWRFHPADLGSEAFEREQSMLLASREGRLLRLIDEALRRLYQAPETFGVCEECGERIAFERLDAIPYVVRCVNCKQSWEGAQTE